MQRYDPLKEPDREEWLALDDDERRMLVEDYHRKARIRVPNMTMHAVVHVIVESQIALGEETPAQRIALRLMDEGLDRHEAIHAIGSVLMGNMLDLVKSPGSGGDPNPAYFAELERLTAESWRRDYG